LVTVYAFVLLFVYTNDEGNVIMRRSPSGIFLFVQRISFSKQNFVLQAMVEAAPFGSEFVTLRICKALIVALRNKLRIFGVPIDGLANVF
jgi:hypothetical protein